MAVLNHSATDSFEKRSCSFSVEVRSGYAMIFLLFKNKSRGFILQDGMLCFHVLFWCVFLIFICS